MSNRAFKAFGSASAALLLIGCATPFQQGEQSARVVPHQNVAHSAGDAAGQYALGKYYLGQGRQALALVAFTKAVELDPSNADARNGRATVLSQFGEHEKAAAELRAAIAMQPEASYLHNNLGYVEYLRGNYRAAAESLRTAFGLDPANQGIRANWTMLVAKVSTNPALASLVHGGVDVAVARAPAPTQMAAPQPTPEAVRSVWAEMSRSVVNIDRMEAPAVRATDAGQGQASASVGTPSTITVATAAIPREPRAAASSAASEPGRAVINLDRSAMMVPRSADGGSTAVVSIAAAKDDAADRRPARPVAASASRPVVATTSSPVVATAASPVSPVVTAPVTSTAPTVRTLSATASAPTTPVAAPSPTPKPVVVVAAPAQPASPMTVSVAPQGRAAAQPAVPIVRRATVEVLNGNGTDRMATTVARELAERGHKVVRVANADTFSVPRSRIYFRDGYMGQALALARQFRTRPAVMISPDGEQMQADVRLVLGDDQGRSVTFAPARQPAKIAGLGTPSYR